MEILHTPPLGDNEILRGKGYFTLKEDDEDSSEVEFADNESEDHKSISHGEEELEGFELQPLDETETNVPPNVSWSTSFTNSGMLLLDEGKEKKKSKKKLSLIQWYKKLDSELADRPVDGWFGWLPVIASFMVHFVMLSAIYTFGVFLKHYMVIFEGSSSSEIAIIGTVCSFVFPLVGVLTGRLTDVLGARSVVMIGIIILTISYIAASFATEIWHLYLTQGILLGTGGSFCYFPTIGIIPAWFDKRRGIAVGISVSGTGIGGLVVGPVVQELIEAFGWRWTLRIIGIASFVLLLLIWPLIFQKFPPKRDGPLLYFDVFKDKAFAILFFGNFMATFGFLIPFYYLPIFAAAVNLTPGDGALLVGILNGSSGAGRLTLGFLADKFGRMNLYCFCMFIAFTSTMWWPFCTSFTTLVVFCFFFGFFGGGFISLNPVVLSEFWGVERLAGIFGIFASGTAVGNFVGVPIGGLIYEATSHHFVPISFYAATMMATAFVSVVAVKLIKEPVNWNRCICCKNSVVEP